MKATTSGRVGLYLFVVCIGLFVAAFFAIDTSAHMGAKGVVKQRMDLMVSMGKAMKAMNAMVLGKSDFDPAALARMAKQLQDHGEQMVRLFPEGSMQGPTEARPEIWADWEGFARLASSLSKEAGKLAQASGSGDRKTIAAQFRRVGKVCSSCHKDFRRKTNR